MATNTTGSVGVYLPRGAECRASGCSAPGRWLHHGWSLSSGLWQWLGEPPVSCHGQAQRLPLRVAWACWSQGDMWPCILYDTACWGNIVITQSCQVAKRPLHPCISKTLDSSPGLRQPRLVGSQMWS